MNQIRACCNERSTPNFFACRDFLFDRIHDITGKRH